jgi:hypothetical protein
MEFAGAWGMTIQHGGRGGKSIDGLRLVHGSGRQVASKTDIPAAIADALHQQFNQDMIVLFRRANVNPRAHLCVLEVWTGRDRGKSRPTASR